VVAPRPEVITPPVQQIAATQTPATGAATTQGASELPGPGTGAGGAGNGTGSGSAGNGAGGPGGVAVAASLVRGISGREYPEAIQHSWPRGGVIYIRLRVEPNGRPSRCDVMRSFGDAMADQWTCALLMQRAEFRPALDARGAPVASWFGYKQVDIGG
jgi:protein TonB